MNTFIQKHTKSIKKRRKQKEQSLWRVILDMLEQYIAMSNVTLQTGTQAAVLNALIHQRIVTEHF